MTKGMTVEIGDGPEGALVWCLMDFEVSCGILHSQGAGGSGNLLLKSLPSSRKKVISCHLSLNHHLG